MAAALFLMMRKNVLFSFQVNGNEMSLRVKRMIAEKMVFRGMFFKREKFRSVRQRQTTLQCF